MEIFHGRKGNTNKYLKYKGLFTLFLMPFFDILKWVKFYNLKYSITEMNLERLMINFIE